MKLLADHIKLFDKMVYKFEKFLKSDYPEHLDTNQSDLEDHFENYIYFDEEYEQIKKERHE